MVDITLFNDLNPRQNVEIPEPHTYSITSDILAYRRCPRQYFFFRERGFIPPNSTQLYFGTVMHQTLDIAHAHYHGIIPNVEVGSVPSKRELFNYFRSVENGLFAHGVKPYRGVHRVRYTDPDTGETTYIQDLTGEENYETLSNVMGGERATAFFRISIFNEVYGPYLYPDIADTEGRLDVTCELADLNKNFIMTGKVDVIRKTEGQIELWDYKSYKKSELSLLQSSDEESGISQDIKMQMRIYADIYRNRNGILPSKGIVVCLGDIKPGIEITKEFIDNSLIVIDNLDDTEALNQARTEFENTVREIEILKERGSWLIDSSDVGDPGKNTCDGCAIRWGCPICQENGRKYPNRFP